MFDRTNTERYLQRLDPSANSWTFQTFVDAKGKTSPGVTGVLIGSLDKHMDELVRRNKNGAGIFITVNQTNGKGRKKSDVIGIRALWQEDDRGNTPSLPTKPHMVVESSPGKYHRYIITDGGPVDEFELVQQRMVDDYGSDPNAKDRSRVLRLPGFLHLKNPEKPHTVRIIETNDAPALPWEELKQLFPPVQQPVVKTTTNNKSKHSFCGEAATGGALIDNPGEVISAVLSLDPDMGYVDWLSVGMGLHNMYKGHQEGLEIWVEWSKSGNLFRPGECEYRWETFK